MLVIICTWKSQRMGTLNLKLMLISWAWGCTTFHNFLSMLKKKKSWQVCDWLAKWLIMSGYMDLRQLRVYRCSNVSLVTLCHHWCWRVLSSVFAPSCPSVHPCYLKWPCLTNFACSVELWNSLQWRIMGVIVSQITSLPIVYSTVYSSAGQRKHQSSVSLAFVCGIHWWSLNSPHKWPVTWKMFPFDDVIMFPWYAFLTLLTHWGRVMHICVIDLTSIGSDNGLLPGRHQAIIRTNAGILLIRPLGTNFSEILIEIMIFSFKKMRLKVLSAKRRPFCLGLNVLRIPGVSLQFGGMMHTVTWSRLLYTVTMLGQFSRVLWKFEIFYDRLGPGLRDDVTTLFKDFIYRPEIW